MSSINPSQLLEITHPDFFVNIAPAALFLEYRLSQLDESCINVNVRLCRSLHEFQSMLFCQLKYVGKITLFNFYLSFM